MIKRLFIIIFIIFITTSLYAEDYLERDLFGLGITYTIPNEARPGMFGLNVLYTPADFFTGFTAIAESDFSSMTKTGLGIERYIILVPGSMINLRSFHLSIGALGTYTFTQAPDYQGLGYEIYATTGLALPPLYGLAFTLSYNHIHSFSFRLEYSGAVFLEKIE